MHTRSLTVVSAAALGALLITGGCGSTPAAVLRPSAPTYAGTIEGSSCKSVEDRGEPLVVDWRPDQRADLELTMKDRLAVVHYDCGSLRLLKDCSADGDYGFVGVTRKEQLVRLDNEDELKANLPFGAASMGAHLSADLQRGGTLDVALIMIGLRTTTRDQLAVSDLHGRCDGATHFVRRATVGAFAMQTGTRAQIQSIAGMFGAGAQASSGSTYQVQNRDGSLEGCAEAGPDSSHPPAQCGALLRLELEALGTKPSSETSCRSGMVLTNGICAPPQKNVAHECAFDPSDCQTQCTAGNARSCMRLGTFYETGQGVGVDRERAAALYRRACDDGDARGCGNLGFDKINGVGVSVDREGAKILLHTACDQGEALACSNLGSVSDQDGDEQAASAQYKRACEAGEPVGCANYGLKLLNQKKSAEALTYFKRGCPTDKGQGCSGLADAYEEGAGVAQDFSRASELYRVACNAYEWNSCMRLGALTLLGEGGPKQPEVAAQLFQLSCNGGSAEGCFHLAIAKRDGVGVAKQPLAAVDDFLSACERGFPSGCTQLAFLFMDGIGVAKDIPRADRLLESACEKGESNACGALGDALLKDKQQSRGLLFLKKGCDLGNATACAELTATKKR